VVLIERGIVEPGPREALGAMARFRKRLVHLYGDIDDARGHRFLQEGLGDLEGFGTEIARRAWWRAGRTGRRP
jgi:uncharacterized protein YutE (UPF0331/DUF86 family)